MIISATDSAAHKDMSAVSAASSESDTAFAPKKRWTRNNTVFLVLAVLCLTALEWHLFRRCFMRYIAPYYPTGWDQLSVYTRIYGLHYGFQKIGLGIFFQNNAWLLDKASMKGFVSQLLGVVMTNLFGVNRLAAGSVNFVWLIIAQAVIFGSLFRRYGVATAALAIGLFFTSMLHYIGVGGIFDLRLDYVGMTIFGAATMILWNYLEFGGKSRFAAASAALFLAVFARSILIFYLVGGLLSLSSISLLLKMLQPKTAKWAILCKRAIGITTSSLVALATFLGLFWHPFYKYYLERAITGENAQWASHYGVNSRLEIILFNIQSFWQLFGLMFGTLAVFAFAASGLSLARKKRIIESDIGKNIDLFLLSGCVSLATFVCICAWMPSPNSIGVLTVPFAVTMASLAATVFDTNDKRYLFSALSVFVFGFGFFAWQMVHPSLRVAPPKETSDVVAEVHRRLIGHIKLRDRTRICYPLETEGLHPSALQLQWYEREQKPLPENLEAAFLPVYRATKWADLKKFVDEADFVIMPSFNNVEGYKVFDGLGQSPVLEQLPALKREVASIYPRREIVGEPTSDFKVTIFGH